MFRLFGHWFGHRPTRIGELSGYTFYRCYRCNAWTCAPLNTTPPKGGWFR